MISRNTDMMPLPFIAMLPPLAIVAIAGAATRTLGQVRIDSSTSINLMLVLAGMGGIVTFTIWLTKIVERARMTRQAQNRLLELMVDRSPFVRADEPKVKEWLGQLRDAEGKPPKREQGK